MKEIWKDILGYEGYYQVSNKGNIRSLDRLVRHSNRWKNFNGYRKIYGKNKILILDKDGYPRTTLYGKDKKSKRVASYRCVALAFIENPNDYKVVNHINGIKSDSRVENLEWCTSKQNELHAVKNNLKASGEKNGWSKLKKDDILIIREMVKNKKTYTEISKIYNISIAHTSRIAHGICWRKIC